MIITRQTERKTGGRRRKRSSSSSEVCSKCITIINQRRSNSHFWSEPCGTNQRLNPIIKYTFFFFFSSLGLNQRLQSDLAGGGEGGKKKKSIRMCLHVWIDTLNHQPLLILTAVIFIKPICSIKVCARQPIRCSFPSSASSSPSQPLLFFSRFT